jgi:putative DNA methylase
VNPTCEQRHAGRFFKKPDANDLCKVAAAARWQQNQRIVFTPNGIIPAGDETDRLHRWGYYR